MESAAKKSRKKGHNSHASVAATALATAFAAHSCVLPLSLSLVLSLSKPGPDISKPKTRNENICKYVKNAEKCCLPTAAAAATATAQKLRQIELPKCWAGVCVERGRNMVCLCVSVWALSHGHNHNASRLGEREPLPIWQVIALCNYCHIKFCTHS